MFNEELFDRTYYLKEREHYPFKRGNYPFEWLEKLPSLKYYMGLSYDSDLSKLLENCKKFNLILPNQFIHFMSTPELHTKIGTRGEYFRLPEEPLYNPYTKGYMIYFITDSQYCWDYYLHLYPNTEQYHIVYADDEYYGVLASTKEELLLEYKDESEIDDILKKICLIENDFDVFIHNRFQDFVEWFREYRDGLIYVACCTNPESAKRESLVNIEDKSIKLLGICESLQDENNLKKYMK